MNAGTKFCWGLRQDGTPIIIGYTTQDNSPMIFALPNPRTSIKARASAQG